MSDVTRLIYSFPPRDGRARAALSDVAYDRRMREYVAAVEGLSAEGLMSGGGGGGGGAVATAGGGGEGKRRRDVLEVC